MKTKIVLSKQNAHRAAVVRNIKYPEWGDWAFHYKAQELPGQNNYAHIIGMGSNSKVLHTDSNMLDYEIVSYKYPVLFEEFDSLAYRAFNWTSFSPDERGVRTIKEYEEQLNADLKDMSDSEKERYIANYKKYFSAWLSAHSNCASSAITGGSGFNVRRAEKANKAEAARYGDFVNWREKALKVIAKREKESHPEKNRLEQIESLINDIISSAATIHGINIGVERRYSKALFVSSIYNKVETYAKRGDVELVKMAIQKIREFNERKSVVITERHKFFKLDEIAEANREKKADAAERENTEAPFKGGKVVNNFAENRIQLIFDGKPDADIIGQLKKAAFKWSPRFGAWQRQMTANAAYAVKNFLKANELWLEQQ